MKFIDLKNREVLNILERVRYLYREKYDMHQITRQNGHGRRAEDFTSLEYMKKVVAMGTQHDGFPRQSKALPLKPENAKNKPPSYEADYNEWNTKLRTELGVKHCALSQLYPPGGFIDWHNNANASSFNIIFTWNETGDGRFKWLDPDGETVHTMQDKKGWSAKCGYFARYGEEDKPLVYHCASTESWRITVSYILGFNEDYWEDMIDHLESE